MAERARDSGAPNRMGKLVQPPEASQSPTSPPGPNRAPVVAREKLIRLYTDHRLPLIDFLCVHKKRSLDDAKDIAQEAFIRIWSTLATSDQLLEPSYLYKTAINLLIDRCRQRSRQDRHTPSLLIEPNVHTIVVETYALNTQQIEELRSYVAELPFPSQEAFRLWYVEGKLQREIAKELNVSTRMVTHYITQATCYCRLRLDGVSARHAKSWMKK